MRNIVIYILIVNFYYKIDYLFIYNIILFFVSDYIF